MDARLQACANRLSSRAAWVRDSQRQHVDDGWTWKLPLADHDTTCQLSWAAVRSRWLVVIGDSRGRMVYSALLAMLNNTMELQLGWPTHRVGANSSCTAHVPRSAREHNTKRGSRGEEWGWYNPQCQARWKGPCWDDARAQYPKRACLLDFTVAASSVRLTFVWHSRNDHVAHTKLLGWRIRMLLDDAARTPDLLLVSTGLWDMQMNPASDALTCCQGVRKALDAINVQMLGHAKSPGSASAHRDVDTSLAASRGVRTQPWPSP